jgi:RimJ/RimL family protein N-acetyltransferase
VINTATTLRGARLDLVPISVHDAAHVYDDARDPEMYRYLQARPPASLAELEDLYERWSAGSADASICWLNWIVIDRASGERVGHVQATLDAPSRSATIGYSIFRRFHRRGFAREAARTLLAYLRERGDIDCVNAEISAPNTASRAVVAALGFVETGTIPGSGRDDGRVCDDVVYTLLFDASQTN